MKIKTAHDLGDEVWTVDGFDYADGSYGYIPCCHTITNELLKEYKDTDFLKTKELAQAECDKRNKEK